MIDLWQEIYGTIKRNKLRTFLTGFAVAWGIFMLIVLLGAGNGIIHAFEQNASERALNSIRLGGGWTTKSYEGLKEGRRIQMENKDLAATEKYFPDNIITAGATLRQGDVNISFGQEYINISLMGVHPNYVQSEAIKTATGRFINRNDIKERRKVIILQVGGDSFRKVAYGACRPVCQCRRRSLSGSRTVRRPGRPEQRGLYPLLYPANHL